MCYCTLSSDTVSVDTSSRRIKHFVLTGTNGIIQVMQNRYDGSVNFTKSFNEYENGFGDLQREFWLGKIECY